MGFNSAFKVLMLYREVLAVSCEIRKKRINTSVVKTKSFLGVFAALRKATVSSVLSVCVRPFAWMNLATTGRIIVKFNICVFFTNLSRQFEFH